MDKCVKIVLKDFFSVIYTKYALNIAFLNTVPSIADQVDDDVLLEGLSPI